MGQIAGCAERCRGVAPGAGVKRSGNGVRTGKRRGSVAVWRTLHALQALQALRVVECEQCRALGMRPKDPVLIFDLRLCHVDRPQEIEQSPAVALDW